MRVALACPYAWDDPGGVQVHVRELAERLRAARARRDRARAHPRAAPAVLGASRSGRRSTSATTHPTRRSTPDRGRGGWSADGSRRSGPTSCTRTSRSRRRRGCGRRSRRARPWWARSIRAPRARACTTSPRRCSAARQPHLTVRIAVSERAADVRALADRRDVRIIPNGVDVARFADAAPADLGAGPQAPVRRPARRAQGVPGRGRGVRAAGRRPARRAPDRGGRRAATRRGRPAARRCSGRA